MCFWFRFSFLPLKNRRYICYASDVLMNAVEKKLTYILWFAGPSSYTYIMTQFVLLSSTENIYLILTHVKQFNSYISGKDKIFPAIQTKYSCVFVPLSWAVFYLLQTFLVFSLGNISLTVPLSSAFLQENFIFLIF